MSGALDFRRILATYGTAIAALLLFCFFAVAAQNFLNPTNLLNVLKQVSFLAILGIGFGLAFTVAELDLSFAAVCSFCTGVAGGLVPAEVEELGDLTRRWLDAGVARRS